MSDSVTTELLAELKTLNASIATMRADFLQAASMIAAAQLIAVDASRSEVYATLMDDQLVETARRLAELIGKRG